MERIAIDARFYIEQVLPQIAEQDREHFYTKYPAVSFEQGHSLGHLPMVMLVALTGTGKTTTLNLLTEAMPIDSQCVPSRRDLANMVIIPTAQVIAGDVVQPVSNRVERFRYTGLFADYVAGGYAEAYQWLHLTTVSDSDIVVCEGIRGHHEIDYALNDASQWNIIELSAQPVTRLERLSRRDDAFDRADGTVNLDFLPDAYCNRVRDLMNAGRITSQALTIMRAEAQNYGLMPYDAIHPRYELIQTDTLSPEAVTQQVQEAIAQWYA